MTTVIFGALAGIIAAVAGGIVGAKTSAATARELDGLNARRSAKERERSVRGVARLIAAELDVVRESIERAFQDGRWQVSNVTPHGAWDRDGALLVETVAEDEALDLIRAFSLLVAWETTVRLYHERMPGDTVVPLAAGSGTSDALSNLSAFIDICRPALAQLAYPDARNLPPDPDAELRYLAAHRRRFWRRGRR